MTALSLLWVATLAVKQQSRTVRFESAAQMLEFLQLPKDGLHYRRLVQGFQRIFAASIFFGTERTQTSSQIFDWARFSGRVLTRLKGSHGPFFAQAAGDQTRDSFADSPCLRSQTFSRLQEIKPSCLPLCCTVCKVPTRIFKRKGHALPERPLRTVF